MIDIYSGENDRGYARKNVKDMPLAEPVYFPAGILGHECYQDRPTNFQHKVVRLKFCLRRHCGTFWNILVSSRWKAELSEIRTKYCGEAFHCIDWTFGAGLHLLEPTFFVCVGEPKLCRPGGSLVSSVYSAWTHEHNLDLATLMFTMVERISRLSC